MNTFNKIKYSGGQTNAIVIPVIFGVVLMFVGLFMISTLAQINPDLKTPTYTTVSNTTWLAINGTTVAGNNTYTFTISSGYLTPYSWMLIGVWNNTASQGYGNINVSVNGVNVGTIAIPATWAQSNVTAGLKLQAGAPNNITFEMVSGAKTAYPAVISNITMYYASGLENTVWGTINNSTVTTTGTLFSVMGLILIIVSLAYALGILRGGFFQIKK